MNTDIIEKMEYIETHFDVKKIKCGNFYLWPFLRNEIYLKYLHADNIQMQRTTIKKNFKEKMSLLFQAIKISNFSLFFCKNSYILFTNDLQFRLVDGKMVNQLFGEIEDSIENLLPIVSFVKSNVKNVYKKCIDQSFIDYICLIYSQINRKCSLPIEGETELRNILKYMDMKYDWRKRASVYITMVSFYRSWFKIIKPKALFVECYYDIKASAIYAAKQLGIPTVELQHGSLNRKHFAYTGMVKFKKNPIPDYFLCFGEKYRQNISPNIYKESQIIETGFYYLELMEQRRELNQKKFKKKYPFIKDKIIVTVASQIVCDKELMNYCMEIAKKSEDMFLLFVPRIIEEYHKTNYLIENFSIENELDIYQLMQNSDVTLGANSTSVIESLVFGTPSVLVDWDGAVSFYYGDFLDGIDSIAFSYDTYDTINKIRELSKYDRNKVREDGKKFYCDDCKKRTHKFISYLVNKNNKHLNSC